MSYSIQTRDDADWGTVGPWFESFIELGQKLHEAKSQGKVFRRVLIAAPQSEMVSLALAIGFSRSAFLLGVNRAEPVELDEVVLGDLIQIRGSWDQKPGQMISPINVVGRVESLDKPDHKSVNIRIRYNHDTTLEDRKIMKFRCPSGEKDPLKHVRIFRVPEGTPERPGKTPREFENKTAGASDLKLLVKTWEAWEYQVEPALAIFGAKSKIIEYGKANFEDEELHKQMLRIGNDSLLNAARLDSLTVDVRPHFVNAIEQVAAFPKKGTSSYTSLSLFPFVCLDGNAALVALSDRKLLDGKCVIGIWETGKPNLQELALSEFVQSAARFNAVDNLPEFLNWAPPSGVHCWGWS